MGRAARLSREQLQPDVELLPVELQPVQRRDRIRQQDGLSAHPAWQLAHEAQQRAQSSTLDHLLSEARVSGEVAQSRGHLLTDVE